jgi:hypothetical protein
VSLQQPLENFSAVQHIRVGGRCVQEYKPVKLLAEQAYDTHLCMFPCRLCPCWQPLRRHSTQRSCPSTCLCSHLHCCNRMTTAAAGRSTSGKRRSAAFGVISCVITCKYQRMMSCVACSCKAAKAETRPCATKTQRASVAAVHNSMCGTTSRKCNTLKNCRFCNRVCLHSLAQIRHRFQLLSSPECSFH